MEGAPAMRIAINKIKGIINDIPGIIGILYIYRYTSWFFTSVFYLTLYRGGSAAFKLAVVLSLLIAAKIATDIYVKHYNNYSIVEVTILSETFGIMLLLIPTAGISSPFMWYALNPVLVAACFLAPYFCWLNLGLYLIMSALITYFFFLNTSTLSQLLYDNLYLMLVFVLITLLVQFLSLLTKKLKHQTYVLTYQKEQLELFNNQLVITNKRYEQSIDHIMSLYKLIENFNISSNVNKWMQAFAKNALDLTKAESILIRFCSGDSSGEVITVCSGNGSCLTAENAKAGKEKVEISTELDINTELKAEMSEKWGDFISPQKQDIFEIMLQGTPYKAAQIRTASQIYGLIAVSGCTPDDEDRLNKLIIFLANLHYN